MRSLNTRLVGPVAQSVEQLTFNQWVAGSIPAGLTNTFNDLAEFFLQQCLKSLVFGTIIGTISAPPKAVRNSAD